MREVRSSSSVISFSVLTVNTERVDIIPFTDSLAVTVMPPEVCTAGSDITGSIISEGRDGPPDGCEIQPANRDRVRAIQSMDAHIFVALVFIDIILSVKGVAKATLVFVSLDGQKR